MKRYFIVVMLMLCTVAVKAQQDAQQSQYMFNGIYINPAYAGYKENLNLHAFYRSQWTGISGAPQSMSLAIDAIANEGNVGLAFQLSHDRLGAQTNMAGYLNYSYRLKMNQEGSSRLAFGLGLGGMQLGINGAMLNPNDPEPNQPTTTQSVILPDARVGVYYSDNTMYAGVSADNLISQYVNIKDYAYIPQPKPHFYLTGGVLLPLDEDFILKPSVLLKDDTGGPTSLDLNAFLILGQKLWLGGSYRTGVKLYNKPYLQNGLTQLNSVIGAAQFFPNESFRIGYAYDMSIGPLRNYSSGTHEISIGFAFGGKPGRMLSPRFF
ncbi:PorP/SprF family type IX secretion system membrane protein [Mucilaginibacter myungsuensis]|uniref:Type IX secretion system membrane protein PorP/SprF n=1 Tax=Mucilaginibacter myungsuensis TaxID=649104 RepID=A0A929PXM8_9SPHI|nr:type IX secretion system membrane protein PorP/SprF [Mucilaginibacter myungsuensis]MBE9664023.1 type IX secretion system membrane protein PorP/SprF [Mucilaginibacter myungsuensis]MDN3601202.1 type IX secretion system membrane protein PorP/SprF [Mucilaginibacter myungsuensis]